LSKKCDLNICGLKKTKQRTAILELLKKSTQPVSAEVIYENLIKKNIQVSLSTVYRTLETLVLKELITKINLTGDSKFLFELNRMVHSHYLRCIGCKKIITINHCQLKGYEEHLAHETGFSIMGHKLDIYGYCPECRKSINE